MTKIKRQLPNFLTLIRIPLAMLCAYFAMSHKPISLTISLSLFLLASATDYLDGHLARKWKTVSTFGKIGDPIADKILNLGILFVFTYNGIIPIVLTLIIAFREVSLTIIRLLLLPKKVVLAARTSGKIKTFSQFVVLVLIYLILIFMGSLQGIVDANVLKDAIFVLIIWIMAITVYSGAEFVFYNQKAIRKLG